MPRVVCARRCELDQTLVARDAAFADWARWFAQEYPGCDTARATDIAVAHLAGLDADGSTPRAEVFSILKERYPHLDAPVTALITAYRQSLSAFLPPLSPDDDQFLTASARAGQPWGIVTNGSPAQRRKIAKVG